MNLTLGRTNPSLQSKLAWTSSPPRRCCLCISPPRNCKPPTTSSRQKQPRPGPTSIFLGFAVPAPPPPATGRRASTSSIHPLRRDDKPPQHRRWVEFLAAKHGDSVAEHSRLPFARSQPVTPLIPDPFDRSGSANFGFSSGHQHLNKEAEERAIKEKGFYLHLSSPRTPSEPRLLPLFPTTSPRGEVIEGNGIFSLPKYPKEYCFFSGEYNEPHPAFAWLKCEEDIDSEKFLRGCIKVQGRTGRKFGTDQKYVKISMLKDDVFDEFLERLSTVKVISNGY